MISSPIHAVLVVHPELLKRKGLRYLLLKAGVERVHEAEDEMSAATVAGQERIDLVFTRWPAGGGERPPLLSRLRARGRKAEPQVIVIDEGMSQASIVAAVKSGIAGRVRLPATLNDVRNLLHGLAEPEPAARVPRVQTTD